MLNQTSVADVWVPYKLICPLLCRADCQPNFLWERPKLSTRFLMWLPEFVYPMTLGNVECKNFHQSLCRVKFWILVLFWQEQFSSSSSYPSPPPQPCSYPWPWWACCRSRRGLAGGCGSPLHNRSSTRAGLFHRGCSRARPSEAETAITRGRCPCHLRLLSRSLLWILLQCQWG